MLTRQTSTLRQTPMTAFPLTFAHKGQTVLLNDIHANDKLRKHLNELGLTIGMRLRVIQTDKAGQMIVAVKQDTRIAINHTIAQKMMVMCIEDGI